jgi:alpha-ketoglutarate-dependent taurine dioxygenase
MALLVRLLGTSCSTNLACVSTKPFLSTHTVSVDDIFEDDAHYVQLLADCKGLVFKELHPTRAEHRQLMKLLYRGGDTNFECGPIWDQDHSGMFNKGLDFNGVPLRDGLTPESTKTGWHSDAPFVAKPPSLTSMHMTKCDIPPGKGRTWLMDLEQVFDMLSSSQVAWLKDIKLDHRTGNSVDPETGVGGRNLAGEMPGAFHPALRTHPVTGRTCLYISGHSCSADDAAFEKIRQIYLPLFAEYDEEAPYVYAHEWSTGDLMIWDNRNLLHTFEGGWVFGTRIFDKIECGRDGPYYHET